MRVVKVGLTILIVMAVLFGSYQLYSLHKQVQELEQQSKTVTVPLIQKEQDFALIYLIRSEPSEFHLVSVQRETKGPVSPAMALQALLNGPLAHEELFASVPPTTKLLGLQVHDGLATADFSSELIHDFNGGSLLESYLVQAIVNTLTEFDPIHQVQILVDGEIIESIGGHVLVNTPLGRNN